MTDRGNSATRQTYLTSSSLSQSCQQAASSVRPRNRRVEADDETQRPSTTAGITKSSGTSYSSQSATQKDNPGPPKVRRSQGNSISDNGRIGDDLAQFLGESWTQSWTSVQTFASKLISGGNSSFRRPEKPQLSTYSTRSSRSEAWGPLPPSRGPTSDDIGAESLVKKRDALKAAKMASILESHKSANGGLDITGKHKCRTSDEIGPLSQETEEHLVYVHHVEPNDTYAGIILRYKCREDIFRKSNGLWSRDSVQMRKWLIIPVDACEIKGRPCDSPLCSNECEAGPYVRTASVAEGSPFATDGLYREPTHISIDNSRRDTKEIVLEDIPWSHVCWVQIDSFKQRVEIVRVPRQALGYFPPRRKKSIRTASSLSTPRQSSDISSLAPNSIERSFNRRLSSGSACPHISGAPLSSQSHAGSEGDDNRPAWMRRPGGVGSMSRHVRTPGPDRDYLNSWTSKHIPGLSMEALPSMSVMGSETAHFGFGQGASGIVESPIEGCRDSFVSRQGTGLDRAAAAVEHWLRGALAKRPSTPLLGGLLRPTGISVDSDVDLIELTDTASDDGKATREVSASTIGSLQSMTTGRIDGGSSLKGRAKFDPGGRGAHQKDD
ncbi:hypothetical protein NOR_04114 [Metarhizium rileyi]|uniref:LysM domain-containing protein n=1 Tax=Metarhizium rileyi (strain RCEF 4871) TaxID=1649241 RepID=A0A167ETZ9_METRR|nr:hypothetical protein NOR_04114 [Metarhizium rileyi RCEF 4871]